MDDLISRQAAIDLIENDKIDGDSPFISLPRAQAVNRTCDRHVEGIKNLPSAQRWIPVTERLPEPYSGEYLVTINNGRVYTDVLWFDSPGDGRYESCFYKEDDDGYGVVCVDVVAWMPLPEPYKEEERNDSEKTH